MKKFNDILNENLEGIYDNAKAVDLIVKDYDFIRNFLCKYIYDLLNKDYNILDKEPVDISQLSTVLYDKNGEAYLKYLGIYIFLNLDDMFTKKIDVADYYLNMKKLLNETFILKDKALIKGKQANSISIQIDYDKFLKSDLYKSIKGLNKFNL